MCRNSRGFTLIELLVALALLVILTGALYGTYFSVISARERGGARSEARREISSTLGLLRNELASAFYFAGAPPPAAVPPANAAAAGRGNVPAGNPGQNLEFVVEDRDSFGDSASLIQFTAITPPHVGSVPSSDVEAVRYSVQEQEGGGLTLARESKDLYLSVKSAPYPVIDKIEAFQVECYDGAKWLRTWDTALTHRLPNCVRVTVTVKGGEKFAVVATPGLTRPSTGLLGGSGLGSILSNLPGTKP